MNRAERRKQVKELKKALVKAGASKKEREDYINRFTGKDTRPIPPGSKVKIKYEQFIDRANKTNVNPKLIEWVEKHKDETFTVMFEPAYEQKGLLACLEEDDSNPKWLWHINDLDIVEE